MFLTSLLSHSIFQMCSLNYIGLFLSELNFQNPFYDLFELNGLAFSAQTPEVSQKTRGFRLVQARNDLRPVWGVVFLLYSSRAQVLKVQRRAYKPFKQCAIWVSNL